MGWPNRVDGSGRPSRPLFDYPARSLGPALAAGRLGAAWIYVVGPAVGAAIAVALTAALHGPPPADPKVDEAAQGDAAATDPGTRRRPAEPGVAVRGQGPAMTAVRNEPARGR